MQKIDKNKLLVILEKVTYYLAVIVTPSIYLFLLYNINKAQGVPFRYCIYFGAILAFVNVILFLVIAKWIGDGQALTVSWLCWTSFWFMDYLDQLIDYITMRQISRFVAIVILCGMIVAVCFLFRRVKINRTIANTLAVTLCFWFAFNMLSSIPSFVKSSTGKAYEIKTEFTVDSTLAHPNVYWFHMDGMMSFEAVEKYCGESQNELKVQLNERGFMINEDARLEAGYTIVAIPALTSPTFYDSYLAEKFTAVTGLTRWSRQNKLYEIMSKDGFVVSDVYGDAELINAFMSVGYRCYAAFLEYAGIVPMDLFRNNEEYMLLPQEPKELETSIHIGAFKRMIDSVNPLLVELYDLCFEKYNAMEKSDFKLEDYTEVVNNIVKPESEVGIDKYIVRSVAESLSIESPKVSFIYMGIAHCDFLFDENGVPTADFNPHKGFYFINDGDPQNEEIRSSPQLYYPQHQYAAYIMLKTIDLVLEKDPDAIIILQGDHGMHGYYESWMYEHGYTLSQILDMNFGVMSAVRIPEKYGKLEEPLEPLNISRWLVNNYVGQNYDYLKQK